MTSPRHHVTKAGTPPDREQEAEVLAALPEVEGDLRAVFLKAVEGAEVDATALIRSDDEEGVRAAIAFGVERGAKVAADALPDIVRERLKPNAISAELEGWIKKHTGALVTAVNKESRNAIKATIARATREGMSMRDVRRELKSFVGLHRIGANALLNYRAQLVAEGRDPAQVERMVAKYGNQLLNWRADNIARTEAMAAVSAGRQRGWERAAKDGLIDRNRAKRKWITSRDERTCRVCAPMDGQEVGLEEPFTTGTGENVMTPPVHPSCRCTVALTFAPLGARATVVDTTATETAEPEVVVPGTVTAPPPVVDSPVAGGRTEEDQAVLPLQELQAEWYRLSDLLEETAGYEGGGDIRRLTAKDREEVREYLRAVTLWSTPESGEVQNLVRSGDIPDNMFALPIRHNHITSNNATLFVLTDKETMERSHQIMTSLAKAPIREEHAASRAYRGIAMPEAARSKLQPGGVFQLGDIASFATEYEHRTPDHKANRAPALYIAQNFADQSADELRPLRVVLWAEGDHMKRGTYIAPLSNVPVERELVSSGAAQILGVEEDKDDGVLYVQIQQL